ncbi:MAG: L-seryl-tRNA(Sec) selenium transferase, partial [Longimicrobiales bacterium]|nr:L-seryl-tRNA(Sec) selenium transferase [Longimicrobiales bacterium]
MSRADPRSRLPGVDRILASPEGAEIVEAFGARRATDALREAIEEARTELLAGGSVPEIPDLVRVARAHLDREELRGLRPVLNATGVVLHTNLGRAPIARAAADAMWAAAQGYSNLEFDLESGARGSRYDHCVREVCELTGAEDALVVNNCAGGLMLAMHALAQGREAVVSRGELVEIGGGFRIPEVLESAGVTLREVGATNRTRLADYAEAVRSVRPAVLLKVHRSNFRLSGFVDDADLADLVELAREHNLRVVHDLGSGLLVPPERLGLPPEPLPSESIAVGVDLVIFSGDKLLGGPQAGIIAGTSDAVARLRTAPMCRALRVDKVTLAGLRVTLRLLAEGDRALREIPALAALAAKLPDLEARAERIAAALPSRLDARVVAVDGRVGGGTFPETSVPSRAVRVVPPEGADRFARRLRLGRPAVVSRLEDDAVIFDIRTL